MGRGARRVRKGTRLARCETQRPLVKCEFRNDVSKLSLPQFTRAPILRERLEKSRQEEFRSVLVFFDESFHDSLEEPNVSLGALCGVGIPEDQMSQVEADVLALKRRYFDEAFAHDREIKGKELFKNYAFRLAQRGIASRNLSLGSDLIDYIVGKRLPVFGCVCFEKKALRFQATQGCALDNSFRFLFARLDAYMKRHRPGERACMVFDDRGYGINARNAEAISHFFQRDVRGLSMDAIVRTPFYAISQANNIGLQLADLVTAVISLKFAGSEAIAPYYARLRRAVPSRNLDCPSLRVSGLKVMRDRSHKRQSAGRPCGPRSGQESPTTQRSERMMTESETAAN
jgi:hypothetical protein